MHFVIGKKAPKSLESFTDNAKFIHSIYNVFGVILNSDAVLFQGDEVGPPQFLGLSQP